MQAGWGGGDVSPARGAARGPQGRLGYAPTSAESLLCGACSVQSYDASAPLG